MEPRISPQVFAILSHLVEEKVGLHYRTDDADAFADRVLERMHEAGFESPLDYYYRLRYDDDGEGELAQLVDDLVVGETYFFREVEALRAAVAYVIAPAVEERGSAAIWSTACASGEEPLSLAMLLAERGILDRCTIEATDVSRRAIARAEAGRYGARSLRLLHTDPKLMRIAERWLELGPNEARVRPELARAVRYRRANLVEPRSAAGAPRRDETGKFDLVLCRNVLIYFADDTVQRVAARLADALRPNGRLLVGASESLLRLGTRLRCEERGGTFFYAKEAP